MFKDDELHETRYCESCLELQQKLQEKEQECKELKEKQKSLEVSKELYDSYCKTHCRANDIAINLHKEFSFMEQQQIIPIIQEGIRILRFKRDKYKQALEEIEEYCNKYSTNSIGFKQSILDIINKAKEK